MTAIVTLDELAQLTPEGARLAIGGVHLSRLPMALLQRVIALGRKHFTLIGWGGGLPLELLLEAGAVRKLIFCFSSLDIFGLAPRFRHALESGSIEVEEWSALAMIQGLHAAHFNLPEMPFQLPIGSDLMQVGDFWKETSCALSNNRVGQARRLDIDVLLLHVQRADTAGNIEIQGARGLDLSLLGASRTVLVTAEEIVHAGQLGDAPRSFVLPRTFVTAVAHCPDGAYPASCLPYYSTDYAALLNYVREEQARRAATPHDKEGRRTRFEMTEPRRPFLAAAARVTSEAVDAATRQATKSANRPWTMDELLAVCLSREYDNSSICSVGSVSPLAMVSYLLAKKTHAPGLTIIALNGGFIDIDAHLMSLSFSEPLEFQSAKVVWGGDETYHWYYQQGRITHEVITTAQIDVHGRTNNAWIEAGDKRLRLPGQGGMADVANLHRNFVLYLTRHSQDRFVDTVAFCTASRSLLAQDERRRAGLQPGKVRLLSDLGIFELDAVLRVFRLVSIHPGVKIEQVRSETGGEFLIADPLPTTPAPTDEQLRLLREDIDPFGIRRLEFVPGRERLSLIETVLDEEAAVIREIRDLPEVEMRTGARV